MVDSGGNLDSGNLDSGNLDSGNLDSGNLDSGNLDSGNLDSGNHVKFKSSNVKTDVQTDVSYHEPCVNMPRPL